MADGRAATGAVGRWVRSVRPQREHQRDDILAGLPGAISNVPDGMASGILVGVNPVYGLYAAFAGPIASGLTTSTRLMVVTTTTAAALAAGSALSGVPVADRPGALVLLTLLAGALMILAGIARLGRYTRFVSHSVMVGFLTGVGVNIVFGQLADLLGSSASGGTSIEKAIDVVTHPGRIGLGSVVVAALAIALLLGLGRTRLAAVSSVVALGVPTAVAIAFGLDEVVRVADGGSIPTGLPMPVLPDLSALSPELVAGAFAVAAIVLIQGAGVAESVPNPSGVNDTNRDFIGQGTGNVASGLLQGIPVGGSVGNTALNVASGGKTRWSAIWTGLWMVVILLALSPVVGKVAVPTLAAVLVVAAVGSFRVPEMLAIWRTGPNSQIAMAVTFAATLLLPVAIAVGLGVVFSLLLQLNQEAVDLAVVRIRTDDVDGAVREEPAPARVESGEVVVLEVYGSLFYAGSRTLQARLPDATGSERAVVVLRLRGRTSFGATFFSVIAGYAETLAAGGGRLYLAGLDPKVAARLEARAAAPLTGSARLFTASPVVGESTRRAVDDARTWLVGPETQ